MTKFYLSLFLLFFTCTLFHQTAEAQIDTSGGKGITYVEIYYSLTNTPGTFAGKSNLSLELGKQWSVFSIGFDVGKTTLDRVQGGDTSVYFEIRPNLNIFQQGRFTNTLTIGGGYVLNAKNNFLSELTSGIEYTANDHLHVNVNFGQFYYSGRYTAQTATFFGTSISYYFVPYTSRSSILKPK